MRNISSEEKHKKTSKSILFIECKLGDTVLATWWMGNHKHLIPGIVSENFGEYRSCICSKSRYGTVEIRNIVFSRMTLIEKCLNNLHESPF